MENGGVYMLEFITEYIHSCMHINISVKITVLFHYDDY